MDAPEYIDKKWLDWYRLTPLERWHKSGEIWERYLAASGSLDPEFDPESPFNDIYYDENGRLRERLNLKTDTRMSDASMVALYSKGLFAEAMPQEKEGE